MEDNIDMLIEAYLGQQLTPEEQQAFEARMSEGASLREAVLLSNQLNHFAADQPGLEENITGRNSTYAKELKKTLASAETKNLRSELATLAQTYHKDNPSNSGNKKGGGRIIYFITSAAAIGLLLFSLNFFGPSSPGELYADFYSSTDLPSFTTRSDNEKILLDGMDAFKTGDYQTAILNLSAFAKAEEEPTAFLYTGVAHLELGQIEAALKDFDILANSDALDKSKAYWFKALAYVKTEQPALAKQQLQETLKNPSNFKFKEAEKLLKELK